MDERSSSARPRKTSVPRVATKPHPVGRPKIDKFPKNLAQWTAFAALPPEARSAVYLRSIRAMLLFFTVLTVLGLIAGVVLALVGIQAVDQSNTTTSPLG